AGGGERGARGGGGAGGKEAGAPRRDGDVRRGRVDGADRRRSRVGRNLEELRLRGHARRIKEEEHVPARGSNVAVRRGGERERAGSRAWRLRSCTAEADQPLVHVGGVGRRAGAHEDGRADGGRGGGGDG